MSDAATPPTPTPRTAPPASGCLIWLVGLPIVVILGLLVGLALSGDDEPDQERRVMLDEGTLDGTAWRVDAVRDLEGESCAFLYADLEQLTGGCTASPQDATFGTTTVVFGVAEAGADEVEVPLSDGSTVVADAIPAEGIDGRFYVTIVDRDVDVERNDP